MTTTHAKTGTFRLGECVVDPDRLTIARGAEVVTVEPKTMDVLVALAERAGEVVSADQLIDLVWEGRAMGDNPVYGAVAKLRRALRDEAREARFIETIPRRGYRLAVEPEAPASGPAPGSRIPRGRIGAALVPAVVLAGVLAGVWWASDRDHGPVADETPPAADVPPTSIAVIPFANVSGDLAFDSFGTGFSEDILNTLARIDGLRVIARTSAFAAGAQGPEVPQLAETLGVGYFLAGSVHPEGGRLRVSARLLKADGEQIWSGSYDRPLEESLDVRMEVAESIARMLSRTLTQREGNQRVAPSAQALQSFLAGREYTWLGLRIHAEEAARAYERAIELEPDYADAHAGLARVHVHEGRIEEASRHARRALELSPEAAEAHVVLGLLALRSGSASGSDEAERHLRRAVELNPSLSEARHYLASALEAQGRLREALEQRELGLARDPLHYNLTRAVARARSEQGDLEEAMVLLRRALSWPQDDEPALGDVGSVLWRWSRYAEFTQEVATLGSRLPEVLRVDAQSRAAMGLARLGLFDAAMAVYEETRSDPSWPGWGRAGIAADLRIGYLCAIGRLDLVDEELSALGALVAREGRGLPRWLDRGVGVARIRAGRLDEGIVKLEGSVLTANYRGQVAYSIERQLLAFAYLATGRGERAEQVLEDLKEEHGLLEGQGFARDPASLSDIARIHALSGEVDQALTRLAAALDRGWVGYYELRDDPLWDRIRDHPGFEGLLGRALAIVEAQRARVDSAR